MNPCCRVTLNAAADEIATERRWQIECEMRKSNPALHRYTEARLRVVEEILRARAATPEPTPDEAPNYASDHGRPVRLAPEPTPRPGFWAENAAVFEAEINEPLMHPLREAALDNLVEKRERPEPEVRKCDVCQGMDLRCKACDGGGVQHYVRCTCFPEDDPACPVPHLTASCPEPVRDLAAKVAELERVIANVRRALDDELANLADDGARLSHSVVRRIEAALLSEEAQR